MHDGMPYGRIQGQRQGHEPIQGSRIENLQSREVDRQSPTGLIFCNRIVNMWNNLPGDTTDFSAVFRSLENHLVTIT